MTALTTTATPAPHTAPHPTGLLRAILRLHRTALALRPATLSTATAVCLPKRRTGAAR